MASTGGDILEMRYNHPTLGQGVFYPKSNEGNTFDLGGFRNADDQNMISGDAEPIYQMNRVRSTVEIVVANDMNERNDLQLAIDLASSPIAAEWAISHVNGTVWGMTGKPVGDLQSDVNAATFTLKIGGGIMRKIVG